MPENTLAKGVSCYAYLGGGWTPATICRANEDGTFTVEPEGGDSILDRWYGVTRLELAFDEDGARRNAEHPGQHWFRLYWNQTRMGGRAPEDVARPVTLDDALAALGLADAPDDPAAVAALAAFEARHGLRLPPSLTALARRRGVADAIHGAHCNDPEWIPVDEWKPARGRPFERVDADVVFDVIAPHQGEHAWAVAFDEGDADARVCLTYPDGDDGRDANPMAPSLALFLWDLAQVGACWFAEHDHRKAAALRRGDIGWTRDRVIG